MGRMDVETKPTLEALQCIDRIDPAVRAVVAGLDVLELSSETLAADRERVNRVSAARAAAADVEGVAIETRFITGPTGDQLGVRIYRGTTRSAPPVVLYAHGGYFVTGNLDTDHAQCTELARSVGCVVVSVDYRLAPESRCPTALDDVQKAFEYMVEHADDLDVDRTRIAVMGRDAGAALMARLVQRVFDVEGPRILAQILHQPMIDPDMTPSRLEFQRTPGLNGQAVDRAWAHYLGDAAISDKAVPAHRPNLEGLPAAFISCSEIDPCRDEAVDYGVRLLHAYVHTELHVVAATFHGFDSAAPDWTVSRENRALHAQSLRRTLFH